MITEQEFDVAQAEILSEIPTEFRGNISYIAWEYGHSAGYQEVLYYLRDLVDSIKEPIKQYTKRLSQQI